MGKKQKRSSSWSGFRSNVNYDLVNDIIRRALNEIENDVRSYIPMDPSGRPRKTPSYEFPWDGPKTERATDQKFKTPGEPVVTETEEDKKKMLVGPGGNLTLYRLPDVNLNKYGRKGNRWSDKSVWFSKTYFNQGGGIYESVINSKRIQSLSEYRTSTPTADSGGALSVLNIVSYNECTFNSINQLEQALIDIPTASTDRWEVVGVGNVVRTVRQPVYFNSTGGPFTCQDGNDGTVIVGLSNQQLFIRLKNEALNVTGTPGDYLTTPVFGTIYVMQCKKDMYSTRLVNNVSAQHDIINEKLKEGFALMYQKQGGDQLAFGLDQPVHINAIRDNNFLKEECKVVAARKFLLSPGQECHLLVKLPNKQILSYGYKENGVVASVAPTPIIYNPVVMKKGEFFIVFEQQGGLALGDLELGAKNGALIQKSKLVMTYNQQYTYHWIVRDGTKKKQKFNTETMSTVIDPLAVDLNWDEKE